MTRTFTAAALVSALCAFPPANGAFATPATTCMTLEKVQEAAGEGTTITPMDTAQFHFLQGIYVVLPYTPSGLPPGDGALLLTHDHGDGGLVLWTVANLVCNPTPLPKTLTDYLPQVKSSEKEGEL